MWQQGFLIIRVLLMVYTFTLLVQCGIFFFGRRLRGRKVDKRNASMYALVMASFFLTDTQLAINLWGSKVAGTSAETCKTWRGISVILYPLCMTPVTILLWSRQRFFYQLNMIKRTASKFVLFLSSYIILPALFLFACLVVFFIILYFTPNLDIMEYYIENGFCKSGKSSSFSSIFRALGLVCIVALHCILMYLFMKPLRENVAAQANNAGHIMESKGNRGEHRAHFKSIKDLDHALIKKLAIITGVVIAADVICIAIYVLLKKLGVELSSQQLALDIQVVITSVSNVMCWKHWREIIYPNRWLRTWTSDFNRGNRRGTRYSSSENRDNTVVQQRGLQPLAATKSLVNHHGHVTV